MTRRELLSMAVAAAFGSGVAMVPESATAGLSAEPLLDLHQAGIATPPAPHTVLAAFDVVADRRQDLVDLFRAWSAVAARVAANHPDLDGAPPHSYPKTTFGLGASLFDLEGEDRFGIAARRPPRLISMPIFEGDELDSGRTGGDLTVQLAARERKAVDDALGMFTAAAAGAATARWVQHGFTGPTIGTGPPRDPVGFKDGIVNPSGQIQMTRDVWVGDEGPPWLKGGSYLVARRIHIDLDAWSSLTVDEQERVIGRAKVSGAPLSGRREEDPIDLSARDAQGHLLIPPTSHVAVAAPHNYGGGMILRRSYSYADATTDGTVDFGLLFLAYQRDPLRGFVPIFTRMTQIDALRHFTVHTGGALVAVLPGAPTSGGWVGQTLFDS